MDSGLGSDEERRVLRLTTNPISSSTGIGSVASTKEQKQRHNERLLIGCFIDASSLSDEAEVVPLVLPVPNATTLPNLSNSNNISHDSDSLNRQGHETPNDETQSNAVHQWPGRALSTTGNSSSSSNGEEERRQGALLFRTSIPQYSMLQMELNMHHHRLMPDNYESSSQQDTRHDYEHDKDDEKDEDLSDIVDITCSPAQGLLNSSKLPNPDSFNRPPLMSQVYALNYCTDNDVAANCSNLTTMGMIRTEKNHHGTCETSTPFNSMVQVLTGSAVDLEDATDDTEESKQRSEEEAESHKTSLGFYVDLNEVDEPQPSTTQETTFKKNIFSMVIDFEAPKKEKPRLPSSFLRSTGSKSADINGRKKNGESSVQTKREVSSAGYLSTTSEPKIAVSELSENALFNVQTWKYSDESEPEQESPSRQFVRLSDLDSSSKSECDIENKYSNNKINTGDNYCDQHTMLDLNKAGATGVMCRSIPQPPPSFVESPMFLTMSRSAAAYRSSPPPFSSQTHQSNRPNVIGSRTSSSNNSRPSSGSSRSVARLGTDLLRMFLEEIETDVQVSVNGRKMRAHKCILVSRCQYFAASLSGRNENSNGAADITIPLDGFSYDSVHFAMCHIYSGASHVPDSVSLVELASLADLLCLEGLKEVVSKELQQKHCHSFHPPCTSSSSSSRHSNREDPNGGCVEGILEVLPLAAAYGLDELYQKCLQWIAQHFVEVWGTRSFGQLPRELREKCHRYIEVHLLPDTVLQVAKGSLKIRHTLEERLSRSKWVDVVRQLVGQLYDDCQIYLRSHLYSTLEDLHHRFVSEKCERKLSSSNLNIGRKKSSNWIMNEAELLLQLEDMLVVVCKSLTSTEQVCRSYAKCRNIINAIEPVKTENHEGPLQSLLNIFHRLEKTLEEKLLILGEKVTKCSGWMCIEGSDRNRIRQMQIQQKQQERDENCSVRSTPSFKNSGNSPPVTRLPRATRTTQVRETHAAKRRQQQQKVNGTNTNPHLIQSSSESSSRNSSPLTGARRIQLSTSREISKSTGVDSTKSGKPANTNGMTGSPSLRRSLLMAARVPQQQVPPSPLQSRKGNKTVATTVTQTTSGGGGTTIKSKSTLTQPTASSAAKSAPPRHIHTSTKKESYTSTMVQPKSQSAPNSVRMDITNVKQHKATSAMSRSMTHTSTSKQENISNRNAPRSGGNSGTSAVRRSPDIRLNRATTPIFSRKKAGSGASSGTSAVVSPSSHREGSTDSKITSSKCEQGLGKTAQKKISTKTAKESIKADKSAVHSEDTPTMQRSGTFLKEKPTVLTIDHQQQSLALDTTVH